MIPTITLKQCHYDKMNRQLVIASKLFGGKFPSQFMVQSHHTGKEVRFVVVQPTDVLFDQDQWDGEQQVYRPMGDVPRVECAVVYHQY